MIKVTCTKSAVKSIVWRITGIIILAIITYAYTTSLFATSLITFIHHAVFLVVYYVHERIWLRFQAVKYRKFLKMFTYETLCGNIILGIITLCVTGEWLMMTQITLTYIGIKHVIYIFNECLWKR